MRDSFLTRFTVIVKVSNCHPTRKCSRLSHSNVVNSIISYNKVVDIISEFFFNH